jgi:hypothetical protein
MKLLPICEDITKTLAPMKKNSNSYLGVSKMGYMLTAVVRGTTLIETDTFEVETYKDLPDFVNSRMRVWEEKWNSPMELISLIYVY